MCEKYTELENPSLERVLQIEANKKVSFYNDFVTCILPHIPHDTEDDVSMEDEYSDELESVKDISKKGYKFKTDDWKNRYVDTLDTMDALIHMTENVETSQASASIEEDSVNTKLNKIIEVMMENVKSMKDQMSLLEAENMELRARVSELEGNQNVAPHTQTPVFPTNVTQQNEETRVQTHFDIGANVEIASKDEDIYVKWYPGIVLKTDIRNGVEMLKVEYSTRFRDKEKRTKKLQESVSIDSIRPQPPPRDTKGFELMDKVEAYHNDGWCSGKVHIILTDDIYSVRFNGSTEFIKFNLSDLRIPKEWVDGVWNMEKEIEVQQTQSVKPRQDDHAKKGKRVVGMKRKATAQLGKHVVGMKRKATAHPVDRLAFLQREEKRPIKDFFEYLDYAENNLKEKHVDVAFAMLNQKRIEQSSWFSEQGIPKACFVPVQFLEMVGYSYENLHKPDKKGIKILKGWVGEVVRGLIRPNKMWMQDVDIVYGVVHERLVDHFIGVGIHLMENTITIFHCGVHKVKENPLIQKLPMLIPAIKFKMMNEEINFNDIVPFKLRRQKGSRRQNFLSILVSLLSRC
ncbi:unnamed protein product [Brassica oleracea]